MSNAFFLLIGCLLTVSLDAFVPAIGRTASRQSYVRFLAADGTPQYDKWDGILKEAKKVAEGSYMLHVELAKGQDVQLDYKPGHVLALELEDVSGDDLNDDAKNNGGWMRGPYTVTRSTESSLDVLVRVVGKKSKAFSESPAGTPVRFGGRFKVPILDGIDKEASHKVVLLSTGVGVGPCIGAVELALQDESFPPVALITCYRESSDVVCRDHLDKLALEHPSKFEWHTVLSNKTGRISNSEENMKWILTNIEGLAGTHYHLIGNGQMVNEWKQGLEKAGVPSERVTVEQYFNHKAETDERAIDNIASAIASSCTVEA